MQCIFSNIPSIVFFNINHYRLNEDAKKDYNQLKKVGIFHDNVYSAIDHYNKVINDLNDWWFNQNTQYAVSNFKKKHCFSEKKWINKFVAYF